MNFSIHIDQPTARDLENLVKKTKKTRNALINEALRTFLETQRRSQWPRKVKELAGAAKDLLPFEDLRNELLIPPADPLA